MNTKVNKEIFSKRLGFVIKKNGETTYSIAKKFGLTPPTISRYVSGQIGAKFTTINAFATYFKVNPSWLLGYDVPMEFQETTESHTLSGDEKKLLSIFNSLSIVGKAELLRRGNELTRLSEFMEE